MINTYVLTSKSQRTEKSIAVACSARGTVFLGKLPYGIPIRTWRTLITVMHVYYKTPKSFLKVVLLNESAFGWFSFSVHFDMYFISEH